MRRKFVQFLLGAVMAVTVMGSSMPVFAEETETVTEAVTEASTEAETTAAEESETSDFVEGSALLSDYSYEAGELTENGWNSNFFNMQYIPAKNVSMGLTENEKLGEYYTRNGEDKIVANSEMVALDKDGGYVQMTAEVNPNHEGAEDVLGRFEESEGLELAGKVKEMEIAGKTFKTVSGVIDKEHYMLGVCEADDFVLAIKVKYEDTAARTILLNGFVAVEEEDAVEDDIPSDEVSLLSEDVATEEDTEAADTEAPATEEADTEK